MPKVKFTTRHHSMMKCPMCPYRTEIAETMKNHLVTCGLQAIDEKQIKCPICPFKTTKMAYLRRHNKLMHERKIEDASKSLSSDLQLSDSSDWDNEPDVEVDELQQASTCEKDATPEPKCTNASSSEIKSDKDSRTPTDLEVGRVVRRPTRPGLPGRKRQHEPIFPLVPLGKAGNASRETENPVPEGPLQDCDAPLEKDTEERDQPPSISNKTFTDASVQTDFPKHTKLTQTIVEYVKNNTSVKEITEDRFEYY